MKRGRVSPVLPYCQCFSDGRLFVIFAASNKLDSRKYVNQFDCRIGARTDIWQDNGKGN